MISADKEIGPFSPDKKSEFADNCIASDLRDRRLQSAAAQLQCLQHEQHAARNLLISGHGPSEKLNFSLSLPKQSYHLFRKLHPLINEIMRWRMSHEYQMHFITFWQ